MALVLLHTSDWHLGLSAFSASRLPEQRRFLDALLALLRDQDIDVLLVTGNIFHSVQPSPEAQQLYYSFLSQLSGTGVKKTILIGGNVDSPARLSAPDAVLNALDIHVVGGVDAGPDSWDRCVCPIANATGEVTAVVLAVPYVPELRLGISPHAGGEALHQAFADLYTHLVDKAQAAFPDVPLIATGYLTCRGVPAEHTAVDIHRTQERGGFPTTTFDPRIQYVALGHVLRSYSPEPPRVWYSGAPLAMGPGQDDARCQVLRVDLPDDATEPVVVTALPVPNSRALLSLEGGTDEVINQVRGLTWEEELPPWLFISVQVSDFDPAVETRLQEALTVHPADCRPTIVRLAQCAPLPLGAQEEPTVQELTPEEVFRRLCTVKAIGLDEPLLAAFSTMAALGETPLDQALAAGSLADTELLQWLEPADLTL